MATNPDLVKTLVVDNFKGDMTPYVDGDINSGYANVVEVFGYNPFLKPGNLTWYETATQVDPTGSVVTDLILCGKTRVESGILYVYAVGHTGRVYKIQVNNPATYNPNYDNAVLLTTLTVGTPTFTRGAFIDFYGATAKIYIGHDKGVTTLNFDGTGEAAVGLLASWTQNVPRPFGQFVGKLYIGNGSNLAEIDSTLLVTSYTKLSPGFPSNSQVRDIDVTPDGNYLQIVVSELALADITATTPDTSVLSPANSFIFSWNGTDSGYTSFTTYASATLSANTVFGNNSYVFGYDIYGGGVWNPVDKFLTSTPESAYGNAPNPNAVFGEGNMIYWSSTLPFNGNLQSLFSMYGSLSSHEFQSGYWSPYNQAATFPETDIQNIPFTILVSNFAQGGNTNGYTDGLYGEPKIYFSTLETSNAPTTKYRLYKWSLAPSGLGTPIVGAVYQTQNEIFSKKMTIKEIRVYGEPWEAGVSFQVDIIGSNGMPISGMTKIFTAGSTLTIGDDFAWYTPQGAPTYSAALRITNLGTTNHVISKVEIDYAAGGK